MMYDNVSVPMYVISVSLAIDDSDTGTTSRRNVNRIMSVK